MQKCQKAESKDNGRRIKVVLLGKLVVKLESLVEMITAKIRHGNSVSKPRHENPIMRPENLLIAVNVLRIFTVLPLEKQ